MPGKDYYAILGVNKNASDDEIKKAFRRAAHQHHPDKGGDPAKFKDVNEAYQVLGDKEKRRAYDQFGDAAFSGGQGGFGGFPGGGFPGGFGNINVEDFGDLGDVLGEMFGFGGPSGKRGKARGSDLQVQMDLDFKEAAFGATKTVRLVRQVACSDCGGSGAEKGTAFKKCEACDGQGRVTQAQKTLFGTFQTARTCERCRGKGEAPEKECKTCRGLGITRGEENVEVSIPAGIENNSLLRVTGKGDVAAHGGTAGDLYINVRVKPHPDFVREGNDIVSKMTIPFTVLALGGDVEIETLDGKERINISAGTPAGTEFQIKNKGIPYRGGSRGSHRVTLEPEVPKKLSREQKDLLKKIQDSGL